jgi:hypothetical protein
MLREARLIWSSPIRELLLVAGDQRRVGLGGEAVGKVKRAGSQGVHGISSDLRSLATVARGEAPGPAGRAWWP